MTKKIRLRRESNCVKFAFKEWMDAVQFKKINSVKLSLFKMQSDKRLLLQILKKWLVITKKSKETGRGIIKLASICEKFTKAIFFNKLVDTCKRLEELKAKTKLAIEFWYYRMLDKALRSWIYFAQVSSYKKHVVKKSKAYHEIKLMEKTILGFKKLPDIKKSIVSKISCLENLVGKKKIKDALEKLKSHANHCLEKSYKCREFLGKTAEVLDKAICRTSFSRLLLKSKQDKAINLRKLKAKTMVWKAWRLSFLIKKQNAYKFNVLATSIKNIMMRRTFRILKDYSEECEIERKTNIKAIGHCDDLLKRKSLNSFHELVNNSKLKLRIAIAKYGKELLNKSFAHLRKWAKEHPKNEESEDEEFDDKHRQIENIRKKIYWNKLVEYSKSRQIKSIQREFASKTYNNTLLKDYFSRWVRKYKKFQSVKQKYIKVIKYYRVHLIKKSIQGFRHQILKRQYNRSEMQKAIKHWCKIKYRTCFYHLKLYAYEERRKNNELKKAIEDRNRLLRKTAIQKWLQVGFYWINKKVITGYSSQKNQSTVLKYALFWRNKTLASGKLQNMETALNLQTLQKQDANEVSFENNVKKKEWELMQWLHNVTKPSIKLDKTESSLRTPVEFKKGVPRKTPSSDKRKIARRINEIEKELIMFNNMKAKLKQLKSEKGDDSIEVKELKQEIIGNYPKIKELLGEIHDLKKNL